MSWKVSSAPASEPVSATEMKLWLKVDSSADDDLITELIKAARVHVERQTGIALITQTIQETIDDFPASIRLNPRAELRLSVSPLIAVTSVTYKDNAGDSQTFSSSSYIVDSVSKPPRIAPAYNQVWPDTYNEINSITVTYTAGHSATTDANFPTDLLTAMKYWVAGAYEMRQDRAKRYRDLSEHLMDLAKVRWFYDGC